ncbi:hypothetical protein ACLQ24_00115 [Micromonospora sp. DT4]|uniref:hypothetical protein n=1 Tax=Micromonospora sp. DT4 TaxID=3393438 RepID=UPI003CEE7A1F
MIITGQRGLIMMFGGSLWRARSSVRLAGGALVAVVSLGVAACGSSTPTAQSSGVPAASVPATPSAETQASDAALASYRGYRDTYSRLALTAEHKDIADLRQYTADPALGNAIFDLSQMNKSGLVRTGAPVSTPSVTSVNVARNPHSAMLSDCLDRTDIDTVDKATGKSAEVPGQVTRVKLSVKVVRYDDGRWLVQSVDAEKGATC